MSRKSSARPATYIGADCVELRMRIYSLVPRPFFAGEEKTAWYTLLAHARYSQKPGNPCTFATFERNLPLYSRILRHVGRWLGMVNKLSMVR